MIRSGRAGNAPRGGISPDEAVPALTAMAGIQGAAQSTEQHVASSETSSLSLEAPGSSAFDSVGGDFSGGNGSSSLANTPVGQKSNRGKWNPEEDDLLREAVQKYGGRNWKRISEILVGRTDVQCLHRWQKVLRPGLIKGPWTQEEDDAVIDLVNKYGIKSWSFIARQLKGRLGKQCRERWVGCRCVLMCVRWLFTTTSRAHVLCGC